MKVGDRAITEYMGNYCDCYLIRRDDASGRLDVHVVNDKGQIVARVKRTEGQIRAIPAFKDLAAENERLMKALKRIASMEAFTFARAVNDKHDGELLAVKEFARKALEGGE